MTNWTKAVSRASLFLPLVCAGAMGASTSANAAPPQTPAQQHFNEAMQLFQQGEVEHACNVFEQSYAEDALPGTEFNLAVCREKQGRFADAYRGFDDLATRAEDAKLADKAAVVRARANALLPKLARIDLVHRKDAVSEVTSLTVDSTVLLASAYKKPVYVLPGVHTIDIKHADGVEVVRTSNDLAAGASQSIEMEDPAPLPDASLGPNASAPLVLREETRVNKKQRTAAYVVGGIGAGFVVAGGIFGILAIGKRGSANDSFNKDHNVDEALAIRHTGKVDATFSDVGIGVGAGAIAAAVLLYVTSSHKETDVPPVTGRTEGLRIVPNGDAHGGGALLQGSF